MLYIKEGFQSRHNDICINSIKQKFEARRHSQRKRIANSPERYFLSPPIDATLEKYETINIFEPDGRSFQRHSPAANESADPAGPLKRWSQIQQEQYDSIRQLITVSKPSAHPKKSIAYLPQKLRQHQTSSLIDDAVLKQSQPLRERLLAGDNLMEHIRHRRQSFLKSNSSYLFPELFGKLPKITATANPGKELALAKSMELKTIPQNDIFCSRRCKRSQMKQRAFRMGDLAVKRRRMHTINGEVSNDSQIAPWREASGITKSHF